MDSTSERENNPFQSFSIVLHSMAKGLLIAVAIAAVATCLLAALGVMPWLSLKTATSTGALMEIGTFVQLGLAAFLVLLLAFLPGVNRIASLEKSHRDFAISIEDIAYAYQVSHATDRAGTFNFAAEFDSVRARLDHMRKHPHLGALEPELLDLAAQMSHTSRDIADVYSDQKVRRAKAFLEERQHEINDFQDRLKMALGITADLKRWRDDLDADDRETERQLERLEKDLREVLPTLGFEMDVEDVQPSPADNKVIQISSSPAVSSKTS